MIRKSSFERGRTVGREGRKVGLSVLAGSEVARHSSDPSYGIYAYTAREWDPEINLYYYRARYYDPRVGRFIPEDPIRFGGGINFYSYVRGNPVSLSDPYGLQTTMDPCPDCECNELLRLMRLTAYTLFQRSYDIRHPMWTLPLTGKMSVEGHQHQWQGWQNRMNTLAKKYKDRGCGDPPPWVVEWQTAPVPQPLEAPLNPIPPPSQKAMQCAVTGTMFLIIIVILFSPLGI